MKKTSFLSRIQSYFSTSYHGRFLAYVFAEIGNHQWKVVARFLSQALDIPVRELGRPTLDPEYSFSGSMGTRRADLAVFSESDPLNPVALIEIKYRDRLVAESDTRPAQLEDYQDWCRQNPARRFLILSREVLPKGDFRAMTWTRVAAMLRKDAVQSELVKALVEHLGNV